MKNNSKNIQITFKNGCKMNVQDFIHKQYKSKISNFFTIENINVIRYALETQLLMDIDGEVYRAIKKIETLANYKNLKSDGTIIYKQKK